MLRVVMYCIVFHVVNQINSQQMIIIKILEDAEAATAGRQPPASLVVNLLRSPRLIQKSKISPAPCIPLHDFVLWLLNTQARSSLISTITV